MHRLRTALRAKVTNYLLSQDGHKLGNTGALGLFTFAFMLRCIYLLQSTANPLFDYSVVDAFVYNQWAARMAQGEWLWREVGNYLPVYPAFLALVKIAFGESPWAFKLVQALMGSGTAVLMASVAARLWGRRVGLLTGLLLATSWMHIVFDAEQFAEGFSIFWQSIALLLLVRWTHKPWPIFLAGLALALSAAARANLLLIVPVVIGWIAWQTKQDWRRALRNTMTFSAGVALLIAPIVFHNAQLTGTPMLRAQASWSLYAGLAPEFSGLHPPSGILFQKFMREPYVAGLRDVVSIEHYWGDRLAEVLRTDPTGVAHAMWQHVLVFVNAREWSQEFDVYAYRDYTFLRGPLFPGFWLFGPLGILGLFLSRPLNRSRLLLLLWTVTGALSILPFKASDRYRLPSTTLLAVFAALALCVLFDAVRKKHTRVLLYSLCGLAIIGGLCWPDWPQLAHRKTARHDFFIGLKQESAGRFPLALAAYEKSLHAFPWDPDSPYRIGRILSRSDHADKARPFLEEALRREPDFPEALCELARLELKALRPERARLLAKEALALYPNDIAGLLLLAHIDCRDGNADSEIKHLSLAVKESADATLALRLARRLTALGQDEDALIWYQTISDSPSVGQSTRGQALTEAGRITARFKAQASGPETFELAAPVNTPTHDPCGAVPLD
jgi:tetratricopeptide (TPR) repeat protein